MMIIIAFRMAVFNTVWADWDALSNLDLIKTREEISPCKTHISAVLSFCLFFYFVFLLLFPGLLQLCSPFCFYCRAILIIIITTITITITISSCSCPSLRCLHISPFENFEEFGFAATLSLHCHYHNNDYDRTRWLLITQHILLIDNMGYFVPHPCVLWLPFILLNGAVH